MTPLSKLKMLWNKVNFYLNLYMKEINLSSEQTTKLSMSQFRRLEEKCRHWCKFKTSITFKFDLIERNQSDI